MCRGYETVVGVGMGVWRCSTCTSLSSSMATSVSMHCLLSLASQAAVSFAVDGVICENYSVIEEIFLLTGKLLLMS
jgi:hypothetical protein